jgi:hypothetical protein
VAFIAPCREIEISMAPRARGGKVKGSPSLRGAQATRQSSLLSYSGLLRIRSQ